jgi:hypothetical protein
MERFNRMASRANIYGKRTRTINCLKIKRLWLHFFDWFSQRTATKEKTAVRCYRNDYPPT